MNKVFNKHGIGFSASTEKTAMERIKRSSADNRVNGKILHEDQREPFSTAEFSSHNSPDLFLRNEDADVESSLLSVNNNHQIDDEDDDDVEDDLILGDEDELEADDEKEVADVEIDEDFDADEIDEDDLILDAEDDEEDEDDL